MSIIKDNVGLWARLLCKRNLVGTEIYTYEVSIAVSLSQPQKIASAAP
jgi:hypothetical protein